MFLSSATKIYLAKNHVDMRKSFNGLAQIIADVFEDNPLSGHMFVFLNKRQDKVKILYWDRNGFCLWQKRLEEGKFRVELDPSESHERVEISSTKLGLLVSGAKWQGLREGKDFSDRRLN